MNLSGYWRRLFQSLWFVIWLHLQIMHPTEGVPVNGSSVVYFSTSLKPSQIVPVLPSKESRTTTPRQTKLPLLSTTSIPNSSATKATALQSGAMPTGSSVSTPSPPITGSMGSEKSSVTIIAVCCCAAVVLIVVATFAGLRLRRRRRLAKKPTARSVRSHELSTMDYDLPPPTPRLGQVFYNEIAEEGEDEKHLATQKKISSTRRPGMIKEIVTVNGGVLQTDDITLDLGSGCLSKDTEITIIKDDRNFAFKALLDLELLQVPPRVIEFLPDGIEFAKPADLTVRFDRPLEASELYVLHGTYSSEKERTIWTLVTDEIEVNNDEGFVNMRISGFCFYSYVLSTRGKIARILSHLNHSFSCHAVSLYRRMPSTQTIDVAVVLFSEFVEGHENERDSSQLVTMVNDNGYCVSEKGALKRVDTHRRLELRGEFPGMDDADTFPFKIDVPQLDSVGMVLDNFRDIAQEFPARGKVYVYEVHRNERRLLWTLNVIEKEQEINHTALAEVSTPPDARPGPQVVVMRTTRLTTVEISRLSLDMGVDWDSLAGLMDIPYADREEIRFNTTKYPDFASKARTILAMFNDRKSFCRKSLVKYLEELNRHDLKKKLSTGDAQTESRETTTVPENEDRTDNDNGSRAVVLRKTALSPREMHRLSRKIVDWDSLAGLMDIPPETRDDIRNNTNYPDHKSRAEKVLSIFNNSAEFCREKLGGYLKEIGYLNLVNDVLNGSFRKLTFGM